LRRLAPLDRALVPTLTLLWVVCFALGVRAQLRGGPLPPFVELSVESAGSYPVLTGVYAQNVHPVDPLGAAGLRRGDRLIRVGDVDLRGVGTAGFGPRALDEAGRALHVPLVLERDGQRLETSLALPPVSDVLPVVAASFTFATSALFLLFRARPTRTVMAWFYVAMCWSIVNSNFAASGWEAYAWGGAFVALGFVLFPLLLRYVFLFPDDREPEGRWHRIWPWFFAVQGVFAGLIASRMAIAVFGWLAVSALGALAVVAVATWKYLGADRIARRQVRWAVLGLYLAALPAVVASILSGIDPRFGSLFFASFWAVSLAPVFLVVSILRFNLFDVDRLLSATASYNILLVLFAAGALVVVPRVAEAMSGAVGVDPGVGQIVLSFALAAAVIPAHRRLRPQIDRLFFRERYALDRGVGELLPSLSACADARELTERAGRELHRLLRPEACVVYARVEDSYAPVFAEGRAVPSAFAAESPLVGTLRARRGALSLSAEGRRPDEAALGPFDRAALETLGAEVVVPVRQGDTLPAFLCLGPKRSGDVYTSTDLSLLAAVAETVSQQLQRFDQESVTREALAMQQSLRRYVPGAIAEQLAGGAELASGEREVTVLFVDIRGYTGFAESRRAEEIFSTVNRYTETVSQIVQRHGGSVVEFNGDGMMAVFGAPRELAHKERAAVEAGREIVAAVGSLRVDGAQLSVGVGIATGEAFVGNIRAVDRMIWSAIGNTTNLAARLQSLTRELDAAVVIDSTTWERAQAAAAGFDERPAVPIRGRRETQDVYALPLSSIPASPVS
jgi:class 3 adenylate cyclase